MESSRKFKVKCMYVLEIFKMNFRSSQPGLMAGFVPDREHFISKLKSPYPQKRKRTQKESVCDWFELCGELDQLQLCWKKKEKKKGILKFYVYSHKAASTMPAQLSDSREQSSDSVELNLLISS